jgi:hypothetical protein
MAYFTSKLAEQYRLFASGSELYRVVEEYRSIA